MFSNHASKFIAIWLTEFLLLCCISKNNNFLDATVKLVLPLGYKSLDSDGLLLQIVFLLTADIHWTLCGSRAQCRQLWLEKLEVIVTLVGDLK